MLEENIENITNSESNFAPPFVNHHLLPAINVNRDCLINISVPKKSNKSIYFLHIKFMVKKFKQKISLNNCLFGSVKLTKNANLDKYKYSCYSIGFDSRWDFSYKMEAWGKIWLFLELIWTYLCILIIKIKIS